MDKKVDFGTHELLVKQTIKELAEKGMSVGPKRPAPK